MARREAPDSTDQAVLGAPTADQLQYLVEQYGSLLYRVSFAILHDAGLAEDVVQETLLRAWTSLPSWEGDTPVRWMRRVAKNEAISVLRQRSRLTDTDWSNVSGSAPETERVVEARSLVDAMESALGRLDEQSRLLLVMRETDELSYEEIALVTELSVSAVKAKLYRARHQLRSELRDWEL